MSHFPRAASASFGKLTTGDKTMRLPLWPLQRFLRVCPDRIHTNVISRIANHLLSSQSSESRRLLELNDRRICLAITDTDNFWQFQVKGTRLVRDLSGEPWDVCIRGRLVDFLLLATRAEDPDSLFFARCLSIEGDTEIGLYVKNLLDAFDMDWEAHFSSMFGRRSIRAVSDTLNATGADALLRELGERVRQSVLETASAAEKTPEKTGARAFTYHPESQITP
uniref:Predicted lipid carrier protein YhbT, contains SCP2 domain n=1 Tax=Candidatus Kentrum eta TaxID=2126337 RepID=A0A450VM44_9GAMM|nr:MAG: Predicted lipid carrier protein YhbT, contains SCP2 domain [Candidatus Kentron sp. H]